MWYGKQTDSKTSLMAIFLRFGIFKNFRKQKVIREGHEASTRVEGAPTLTWRAPCLMDTSCVPRTPFSCTLRILVGKNSLYNLPKVLTTVSCKNIMSLFRAIPIVDLEQDVFPRVSRGLSGVSPYTRSRSKKRCLSLWTINGG